MLALLLVAQVACAGDITGAIAEGGAFALTAGECRISKPIVADKAIEIYGAGVGRTRIEAPRGFIGGRGKITLSDLTIWRADRPTETSTRAIGVNASGPVDIERVGVEGFTVGIYVYADADSFGTNANAWRLRDLRVMGSAHAGIIVRGRDANGGYGEAIRVQTNCERATKWIAEFGVCAGIVDRSFLGNTWVAILASTNSERGADGSYTPLAPFVSQGASQHSVWIGPYCERDQSAALIDQATIVVGGLCSRVQGDGLRIDGRTMNGLIVRNDKDPKNVVTLRAGASAASGTFFELAADAIDGSRPLRVKAEPAKRCYRFDIANQLVPLRIGQDGSFVPQPQ